ncbi:MAG: class I SAM-dependent methyltransferase [Acetobacterales bacterium]
MAGRLTEAAAYADPRLYQATAAVRHEPGGVLECPVCGTVARRFLPFGLAGRRNAQCPGCGSVERHRFLWLYLRDRTDILRGRRRVLHTAPEPCIEPMLRAVHGRGYVSVDAFNPAADVRADLRDLPLPDASFDVLVSSHTLEHVPDDAPALAELGRVVRPGGWAAIMVPLDPSKPTHEDPSIDTPEGRNAAFGHPFHFRIYGHDIVDRLRAAGFAAEILSTRKLLSGHLRRRFRINRNYLVRCRRL